MARATGSLCSVGSTRRLVSGRLQELGALQVEQQRSTQGELRMALVLGDAGLGKTRLAAAQLPCDDESTVRLIARSSLLDGMPLFGPWADALGLHTDDQNAEGACRACGSGLSGLPALVRRTEIGHDASSCAQALRYHFVEWIPGLLAKASADRPIVVILDDVHQGHDVVWEMLLRLGWDFPTSRLFVLATARPAELARHRMAIEVLHALEQEAMVCRIQLAPFPRQDVRELATEILGRNHVPSSLLDWLLARAQGNPRCTVGLLEALVDDGVDLPAPVAGGVPEKLARWIRTEVARLDPPALALIEVIAVGGDLVDLGDLARITDRPIEDVALTLERLVSSGMINERRRDRILGYQIAHPLIHEVLVTDIGGARRRVLHRRVAETLRESGRTEIAASHFVRAAQAGDGEAIDALIEMAQRGVCSQVWTTLSALQDLLPIGDERWPRVFDALFQRSNWGIIDRTEYHVLETATVWRMRQLLAGIGDLQRQGDVRLWLARLFAFGAGDLDAAQRECRQAGQLYERAGCETAARMAAI
ncbi:MAG TPA: AAA family ATPase, partial [Pseudonocardiaceae bacterium]|nr:AAA family ATPase [Pseudonocardiaceae bacterium]